MSNSNGSSDVCTYTDMPVSVSRDGKYSASFSLSKHWTHKGRPHSAWLEGAGIGHAAKSAYN